jgi:hypothetical protein
VKKTTGATARTRIAKVAFDPAVIMDGLVLAETELVQHLNHLSRQANLGVVVRMDNSPRHWFVEEWPGALRDAELSDHGLLGRHLRHLRSIGRFSKSEAVQDALEFRNRAPLNQELLRIMDKDRGNKAARHQRVALATGMDEWVAMIDKIDVCNRVMGESIKDDPDCRDIAPNWPTRLLNGLLIPIVEPHKTGAEAFQAPKRTRKPRGG